nr:putative ribonuclease H-like domain-containing protein [Tanacetum cinerariifolium]
GNSQNYIDDKGYWDSGCSRHMTGNISYLSDYEPFDGGYVSFGQEGCKITGKGTIKIVTDDFSWFTWNFFLKTKVETSGILRNFITEIENLKDLKVKIIRCNNRGEFRNKEMNDFYSRKGIKKEFSNARTPQQNGVAERRNKTLIEVARTVLADAKLPVTFWTKAVNTACYVQNRVLSIEKGDGPNWLFNIDSLTNSMNYVPVVVAGTNSTNFLDDSPQLSSDSRLISKRVTSQDDTPSLDNILTLTNRFEDILGVTTNTDDSNGVEADLGNIENNISASPTPTFRIHTDNPKSQIISTVDTPVQTKTKSKEMEEQGFIATIHQKTNPTILQFCLFSCFLS